MKKQFLLIFCQLTLVCFLANGQNVIVEGYIFEDNNRGYLNEVIIKAYEVGTEAFVGEASSNIEGFFSFNLPSGKDYILKSSKDLFFDKEEIVSTKSISTGEKVYVKLKLERKPGYIFDVTLAEKGAPTATVDAITGAKIEVYNNTKREETLVIESLDGINFDVTFERGNHYTVLIRKEGFFNKRLEAYVDVEGCILCFEGVGTVTPGVSDVMSEGFQMGSVLANIELDPARLNRTIRVDNIYYDLDKYYIRPDAAIELDKVVKLMKENPTVIIELGSHTDSRGGTRYNKKLSSQRAKAAVEYIVTKGGISPARISSKGYGEENLVNRCTDGAKCSEAEHQENRRTELKIVGFEAIDPLAERSLADILTEERLLREIENSGQIQVRPEENPQFDKIKIDDSVNYPNSSSGTSSSSNSSTSSSTNVKTTLPTRTIDQASSNIQSNTETNYKHSKSANSTESQIVKATSQASKQSSQTYDSSKATHSKTTTSNTQIISAGGNIGETLVVTGNKKLNSLDDKATLLNFDQDKLLLIQKRQKVLIQKMVGNRLNTAITDLLIRKDITLHFDEAQLENYYFDSIDQIPVPLLNAFLKKLVMVEKNKAWHLYPVQVGADIPAGILEALR